MSQKRPYIITLLGDYNSLGAILLILSFFPFMKLLGIYVIIPGYLNIPYIPAEITKVLLAIIIIIISYGYLKLKKWGYWLIIGENLLHIVGWFITYQNIKQPYFVSSPITSFIELIFIVPTIKYFYNKTDETYKGERNVIRKY